jgi:energy-coupling factor transporter ATP-binding protein EcfA2
MLEKLPIDCIYNILNKLSNKTFRKTQLISSSFHVENIIDKSTRLLWQKNISKYLNRLPTQGIIIILGSTGSGKSTLVDLILEYLTSNNYNIILPNYFFNSNTRDIQNSYKNFYNLDTKNSIILECNITPFIKKSETLTKNFVNLSKKNLIIYIVNNRDDISFDISMNAQICFKTFKFNDNFFKQIIYNQNNIDEFVEDFIPSDIVYDYNYHNYNSI